MERSVQQADVSRGFAAMLLPLVLLSCGKNDGSKQPAPAPTGIVDKRICSDPAVLGRLQDLVIAQATRLQPAKARAIERIGRAAAPEVGETAATGSDPALNMTLCRAQLTLQLPEGSVDAFDGGRQLAAELRYAVQRRAAGGLTVHQLTGAEPLAYRLAAIPMRIAPPAPPRAPAATAEPAPRPERRALAPPAAAPLPERNGLPEPALTARGRPSFDCRRAGSRVARMICRDERLAALDRVTMSLYARTLARANRGTRADLGETQARFIERRDDCRRAGCVADRYRDRLDEIDALAGR